MGKDKRDQETETSLTWSVDPKCRPDPEYRCGADFCDDPACNTHYKKERPTLSHNKNFRVGTIDEIYRFVNGPLQKFISVEDTSGAYFLLIPVIEGSEIAARALAEMLVEAFNLHMVVKGQNES